MKKFNREWEQVKENFYRSVIGKKDYIYMYRVKQFDSIGHLVDTWKRQNEKRQPFRTLREAEAHRKRFISEIMSRTLEDDGIPDLHTLDEIFEDYIKNRGTSLAPNTISKRRGDMKNHIIPYFKTRRIEAISVGEVRNLITQLRGKLAYRTVKSILATLSLVWQYAAEMKIIDRSAYLEIFVDKGVKVTTPKRVQGEQRERKAPEVFSKEQMEQFFKYAREKGAVYYILVMLCYYGGVRRSEALGLCWKDINWDSQEITVSRQLIYDKNTHETYLSTTKSKVNRTFEMSPTLLNALQEWRAEQANIRQGKRSRTLGNGISDTDLVLYNERGMMTNSQANHFKEKVQEELGVHFIFHSLRRTMVSNLAGAGVPIKSVSKFIGHADTRTTEEFYLGEDENSRDKLLSALQDL